ncbi:NF-X1-type zinc finger protein NFXL1 [Tanacetum coccineum]
MTDGADTTFKCDKPCGRKKNCGRHRCSDKCCPLSNSKNSAATQGWDPHLCSKPCEKKLRCGQHDCETLCNSGHCPPCQETIFTDLTCAYERSSIPLPLPCAITLETVHHVEFQYQKNALGDMVFSETYHAVQKISDVINFVENEAVWDAYMFKNVPSKLPVPLQPIEVNGKKIPLGQRKLTCDDECSKVKRKKVLADAFGVDTNLEALYFGESSAVFDMLGDLFKRDPKWVLSVEERCTVHKHQWDIIYQQDHFDSWIVAQEWVNPETSPWKSAAALKQDDVVVEGWEKAYD